MSLSDTLIDSLRSRFEKEAKISDAAILEIVSGLQSGNPVNWSLLLNKETAPAPKDETDH